MSMAEAKRIVKAEYPKTFGLKANGTYRVLSGVLVPLMLASGKSAEEAWQRAAREVNYANGVGE